MPPGHSDESEGDQQKYRDGLADRAEGKGDGKEHQQQNDGDDPLHGLLRLLLLAILAFVQGGHRRKFGQDARHDLVFQVGGQIAHRHVVFSDVGLHFDLALAVEVVDADYPPVDR